MSCLSQVRCRTLCRVRLFVVDAAESNNLEVTQCSFKASWPARGASCSLLPVVRASSVVAKPSLVEKDLVWSLEVAAFIIYLLTRFMRLAGQVHFDAAAQGTIYLFCGSAAAVRVVVRVLTEPVVFIVKSSDPRRENNNKRTNANTHFNQQQPIRRSNDATTQRRKRTMSSERWATTRKSDQ